MHIFIGVRYNKTRYESVIRPCRHSVVLSPLYIMAILVRETILTYLWKVIDCV